MKVQALTAVTLTALLTISAAIPIAEPAQGDGLEARKVTDRKGHPQWGYDAGAFAGNGPKRSVDTEIPEDEDVEEFEKRKVTDRKGHPQWGYDAGAFAGNGP
jgi:hypothetical protein